MFFLVRSTLCIGLVVSALPNAPGLASWTPGSSVLMGPGAVAALDRFCRDNAARCLLAAEGSVEPARPAASVTGRKLRSSKPVTPGA